MQLFKYNYKYIYIYIYIEKSIYNTFTYLIYIQNVFHNLLHKIIKIIQYIVLKVYNIEQNIEQNIYYILLAFNEISVVFIVYHQWSNSLTACMPIHVQSTTLYVLQYRFYIVGFTLQCLYCRFYILDYRTPRYI